MNTDALKLLHELVAKMGANRAVPPALTGLARQALGLAMMEEKPEPKPKAKAKTKATKRKAAEELPDLPDASEVEDC